MMSPSFPRFLGIFFFFIFPFSSFAGICGSKPCGGGNPPSYESVFPQKKAPPSPAMTQEKALRLLLDALHEGHESGIEYALSKGADPNGKYSYGRSSHQLEQTRPLFEAVASGHPHSVKTLLKNAPGIDLEVRSRKQLVYMGETLFMGTRGYTAFMAAVGCEQEEIAVALLEAGAEIHDDELLNRKEFLRKVTRQFLDKKNLKKKAGTQQQFADPSCPTRTFPERAFPSKIKFSVDLEMS